MQALLTAWHQEAACTWCEGTKEAVTVDFGDGFIRRAQLCWTCLHKAVRVRHQQDAPAKAPAAAPAPAAGPKP